MLLALLAASAAVAVTLGLRLLLVPAADGYLPAPPPGGARGARHRIGGLVERVGRPLSPVLGSLVGDAGRARLGARLDRAGRPGGLTTDRFLAKRAGVVTLGLAAFGWYAAQGGWVSAVLLLVVIGGSADLTLHLGAKARQEEIERTLPDLLDAVTVSLLAGSAFRPTLTRLCERWDGALAEELSDTLRQLQVGASRRAAFTALQGRNTSPSLRRFAGAVLQAEELGTSVAVTLEGLSEQMRRSSGQRAKQQATAVENKVILVNAAFFLPAMMVMLITVSLLGFGIVGGGA